MSTFNYGRTRTVADRLIRKFGMRASLRRGGVDRDCWIVLDYLPRENPAMMTNPTDRKVYIAAGLGAVPTTPPSNEEDQLVTYVQPETVPPVEDEILAFTGEPVKPIKPAGQVVVYEATVRR